MKQFLQSLEMNKEVTIIIPSFNTKETLLSCVTSVLTNVKLSFEVIVVDNASSDGSVESVKDVIKKAKHQSISLMENANNLGFAKAVNQGIGKAKGKYILLLNSDTRVQKKTIENLVWFAEKNRDAGVVGAKLLNPDGSVQESCFNFPTIGNAIKEYFLGQKGSFGKFCPKGKEPTQVDAVVGAAFLITPEAIKRVGIFDEKYFMYFEDLDYCRRVKKSSLTVYFLPSSEVLHYHGLSGKNIVPQKDQWKRLIPGSKIYHGVINHYILNFILWSGQKWQRLWRKSFTGNPI
jgi:hypothetical protein